LQAADAIKSHTGAKTDDVVDQVLDKAKELLGEDKPTG